jgi:putative ABC transport system permease protein
MGMAGGSVAYMDARALARRAETGGALNVITAASTDPELARRRLIEAGDYRVLSLDQVMAEADEALAADRVGHVIFIGLTLTIAGLFVTSVLGRSVSQRRIEFATLKAIGIPNRTILAIVAAEALLVSLPAGVVAIGISTILGAGINAYVAPAYDFDRLYAVDAQLFATVFALSVALGATAGLMPAVRATRVDPVDVLREA